MPKHSREEFEDAATLEEVSVLFIPFDAAKKFYQANVTKGVKGLHGSVDDRGRAAEGSDLSRPLVPPLPQNRFLSGSEIASNLSNIVQQECDLIRNIHNPDADYDSIFKAFLRSNGPHQDPTDWSERRMRRIEKALRGYKHYPTFIFLSENPTGQPFPPTIDTALPEMQYVRKCVIDRLRIATLKPVNEMAVYIRKDAEQRLDTGHDDSLFLETEVLVRGTSGLPKGKKDEYILKVTLGKRLGYCFTVAGVHLRASLTGANSTHRAQERQALEAFCAHQGIQVMVGDFNMDLQESASGSRGVFFDGQLENQPRFMLPRNSPQAIPLYLQQYSNSSGNAHYMGYFQADTAQLELVGPSIYGAMGASGSRHLRVGDESFYYSDHPSIYFNAKSTRLTPEARARILQRKIVKVLRPPRS